MRNWLNRLWVRLALASLLASGVAIAIMALSVRSITETSFRHYVQGQNAQRFGPEAIAALEAHYAAQGTWQGAEDLLPGGGQGRGAGNAGTRGAQAVVADPEGVIVAARESERIGQTLSAGALSSAARLTVNGEMVGLLAQETPGMQALGEAEADFLAQTRRGLWLAALGAGVLAVAVSALLAWGIARPVRALTHAAHDLSRGELGRQTQVSGPAELAELAEAFNRMSLQLAAGEQARQRMATDVAHELRTPVTVLRSRLEAMLDGVFEMDAANLAVAYDQTLHLARLVDDLRLLTQAEAGRLPLERRRIRADEVLSQAATAFEPLALDAEVTLTTAIDPHLPEVLVDVDRIQQVMGNLLSNALRHTPPGGRITVRAERVGAAVQVSVHNTGAPLAPEDRAHLFDRFWRAEEARTRDSGGSGLGLAITRQLVQLHGGRIAVENTPDGVIFTFTLPAAL
ncbi:MAG: ATP-binding protein [Anaerolineae bacterium]